MTRRVPKLATALLVAAVRIPAAGAAEGPPELSTLVTPDAPAFVLLGVSPTEIQRPSDPRALAVSWVNALSKPDGDGASLAVPSNLAMEVAPYWLFPRPRLTIEEYRAATWRNLYRRATVSIGTTSAPDGEAATTGTRGALGLRTRVLDGRPRSPITKECREQIIANGQVIGQEMGRWAAAHPDASEAETTAQATEIQEQHALALDGCVKESSARRGWVADLAGGLALAFSGSKASSGEVSDWGGWAGVGYLDDHLSLVGLGRYLVHGAGTSARVGNLDVGARGIYAAGDWGASVEALYRRVVVGDSDDPDQYKISVQLEYLLTRGLWLTVTGGRGFTYTGPENFFGLLNLKVAFDTKGRIKVS